MITQKNKINWSQFFSKIKKMTKDDLIPYVTRLSEKYKKQKNKRAYLVLVSTVISLRTKDKTTEEASERLFALADTPKKMVEIKEGEIAKAIYPCGFYKTKAKQILNFSRLLQSDYKGKVPNNIDELVKFPGVGRKTANLVMTEGFGEQGICVDTHVHRILNRLGFITTKNPDETEMVLRKNLPKRYWIPINYYLVMMGQYHCKPVKPLCGECLMQTVCSYFESK